MSVSAACARCLKSLPEGFGEASCPFCEAPIAPRRRRSLSGFSFQSDSPLRGNTAGVATRGSAPAHRPVIEDRWDLPDHGAPSGTVPPVAPTGFAAVVSAVAASRAPTPGPVDAAADPGDAERGAVDTARPAPIEPDRSGALLDPLSWEADAEAPARTPPPHSSTHELRPASRARVPTAAAEAPSKAPDPPPTPPVHAPSAAFASARPRRTSDEAAFPLLRTTNPPGGIATSEASPATADAPVVTASPIVLRSVDDVVRPSSAVSFVPLRPPPSLRRMSITTAAWWCIGASVLTLAAVVAVHGWAISMALRGASAFAAYAMLARYRGLSTRALVMLAIGAPTLAHETTSISTLSRTGALVLAGALIALPAGAWVTLGRARVRRPLIVVGIAMTFAALLVRGGVRGAWAVATIPALILASFALVSRERWIAVWLTLSVTAWALGCGLEAGAGLHEASVGLAMASLTMLCGRALGTAIDGGER